MIIDMQDLPMPFGGQPEATRSKAADIDEYTRSNIRSGFINIIAHVCEECEFSAPFNGPLKGISSPNAWAAAINKNLHPKPVKSDINALFTFYLSEALNFERQRISYVQYGCSSSIYATRIRAAIAYCLSQIVKREQTQFSALCALVQFIGAKNRMLFEHFKIDLCNYAIARSFGLDVPMPQPLHIDAETLITQFIRAWKR